ncbi:gamma-glutamyltranspeptidase [Salmonella enterica subsp. arizonae]|uniref:Gamma-glutamyltranspeptidase n=1 Tax=Salmonella enterica subsp. arizonae TaxID=59203 RepID=A0A379TTQ0_SALER|nr:gamma-glutamyltranspeptidase [Salmonella enterica subsp. arizonae]
MKSTFMRWVAIAALLVGGTFSAVAHSPIAPPASWNAEEDVFHPVRATQGMVASMDALATQVGVNILKTGGECRGCRRGSRLCAGRHAPPGWGSRRRRFHAAAY